MEGNSLKLVSKFRLATIIDYSMCNIWKIMQDGLTITVEKNNYVEGYALKKESTKLNFKWQIAIIFPNDFHF